METAVGHAAPNAFNDLLERLYLKFASREQEQAFLRSYHVGVRGLSQLALGLIAVTFGLFAYLEWTVLGVTQSQLPLYGLILATIVALAAIPMTLVNSLAAYRPVITVTAGVIGALAVISALFVQEQLGPTYRVTYFAELAITLLWIYGLSGIRILSVATLALTLSVIFQFGLFVGETPHNVLVIAGFLLLSVNLMGLLICYLVESFSRRNFLNRTDLETLGWRHERWAQTLRDLAIELSGTQDLKVTFDRMLAHLRNLVPHDATAVAVIQGRSLKPLIIEGALFELQELEELWTADLIQTLNDTRTARASSRELEEKTLFGFGKTTTRASSHRLDVPVIFENRLLGILTLGRVRHEFDEFETRAAGTMMFHAMVAMRGARLFAQNQGLSTRMGEPEQRAVRPEPKAAPPPKPVAAPTRAPAPPTPERKAAPPRPAAEKKPVEKGALEAKERVVPKSAIAAAKAAAKRSPEPQAHAPESKVKPFPPPAKSATKTPPPEPAPVAAKETKRESISARLLRGAAAAKAAVPILADPLTETTVTGEADDSLPLLGRDEAKQRGEDLYRRAQHHGESLSLCMCDVDGLAKLRDRYGDEVALQVLEQIVVHVKGRVGDEDLIGRYGKDGFTILLPQKTLQVAEDLAEGLRSYVESTAFKTPRGRMSVTLTVGIAAMSDRQGNYDSMVRRADQAVFSVKKTGGNAVKVRL
jgi:diguanylate cyclase (GGDEF)-like protein